MTPNQLEYMKVQGEISKGIQKLQILLEKDKKELNKAPNDYAFVSTMNYIHSTIFELIEHLE